MYLPSNTVSHIRHYVLAQQLCVTYQALCTCPATLCHISGTMYLPNNTMSHPRMFSVNGHITESCYSQFCKKFRVKFSHQQAFSEMFDLDIYMCFVIEGFCGLPVSLDISCGAHSTFTLLCRFRQLLDRLAIGSDWVSLVEMWSTVWSHAILLHTVKIILCE